MKTFRMIGFVMFVSAVFSLPLIAADIADRGPETMKLKERFKFSGRKDPVVFQHWTHQEILEDKCSNCHQKETGGGALKFELVKFDSVSNDIHNKFCWPCHRERKVPKGVSCKTCHE